MKRLTHLLIILVTLFFLLLLFSSCDKDLGKQPCNCGTITSDHIEFDANSNIYYTLVIQNDCSNNQAKYYFDYQVWVEAHVGQPFCLQGVSSWAPLGPTTLVEVGDKKIYPSL